MVKTAMDKTLTRRNLGLALAPLFALGVVAFTVAEEAPTKSATKTEQRSERSKKGEGLDRELAACLVLGNQNEIAAAKLGEQSQNHEVVEFAQMMQKQHQMFLTELQEFAGDQYRDRNLEASEYHPTSKPGTRTPPARPNTETVPGTKPPRVSKELKENIEQQAALQPAKDPGETKTGNGEVTVTARKTGADEAHSMQETMRQIKLELADECLASTRRELKGKTGKEFDATFIGMNLAAHIRMIDELTVFERHASSEFKPVLAKGRETAMKHLDHARQIMKNIEEGRGASGKPTAEDK